MKNGDKYFVEMYTENLLRKIKIDELYFEGRTKYQKVHCFSNEFLGKTLFLDEKIQSAQIDEYVYHEALVHPSLLVHPSPKNVLVIGGGEGATIREVLRHPSIQNVTMVDIDEELVGICEKYLPEWSDGAFDDKRTDLSFLFPVQKHWRMYSPLSGRIGHSSVPSVCPGDLFLPQTRQIPSIFDKNRLPII